MGSSEVTNEVLSPDFIEKQRAIMDSVKEEHDKNLKNYFERNKEFLLKFQ